MVSDELLGYIKQSKVSGLSDDEIKKALSGTGWNDSDVNEAFNQLSLKPNQVPQEFKKPAFNISPTLKNSYQSVRQHPQLKYIAGVVLVIIASFVLYKTFRHEKVAISEFTLTASAADAAGINPDSTFTLKSTADLDESVVEKYLSVEPKVEIKVNKTGTNTFEIKPKEKLPENKVFAVKIDAGPIADKTFSWAYQVKAPFQVIGTLPRDESTSVPLNSGIEVTLNREGLKNTEGSFEISPNIQGRLEVHRNILIFVPTQELQQQTVYTVTLKKGLKVDGSDDTLADDTTFKFETGNKSYGYTGSFSFNKVFWEFKPDTEPAFEAYSYNLTSALQGKAYRFDNLNDFINAYKGSLNPDNGWSQFNRYKPYQAPDNKKFFEGPVSIEDQLGVRFVRIPQKLNEGYYLFDVTVEGRHEQVWFQITPLSNYAAISGTKSLVWIRTLEGGQPITGANISFDGKSIGKTNSDGVAQFDTPDDLIRKTSDYAYHYSAEPAYFYTVSVNGKELAIPIESRYGGFSRINPPDQWWSYMSVDKTIYQPNDTLRFWGLVKQRGGSEVKGEEIVMQLTEPVWGSSPSDLTMYASTKAKISDFNSVTGEMSFSGLRPGMYQLSVRRGDEIIISQSISVETYIKPAYKLIITPKKNAVFAGETISFDVKGEFFDGTPVSNLQVKYQSYQNGQNEGQVKLNSEGQGSFSIKTNYTESSWWPQYMGVTVMPAVSEEGEIAESASVLVFGPQMSLQSGQSISNQSTKFKLKLQNITLEKIEKGQPFWVSENYLGGPVGGYPISVEVIQITHRATETGKGYDIINKVTYPIYTYSREEKSIRKADLVTDGNGEASFEQALEKEKTYKIIFTARDRNGRLVKKENYAYGGSISSFSYYDTSGITLKNLQEDKNDYKLGDRISLQVQDNSGNAMTPGNRNFLFFQVVNGISSYQISDSPDYNDTFQDKHIPNVSVVGVWFSGNRFHDSWPVNISFNSDQRRLNINVRKDKDRYKPGEEVKLSIEVKDQDERPKQADVNVAGLDEAVFTLNPEEKDITNDLYRDLYVSLITRSSHLTPLESGAEQGGCFLPGTQILTSVGNKNIEDIKAGDYILTKEKDDSDQLIKAEVKRTTTHLANGYLIINDYLKVTENHRLFVNGEWIKAGSIEKGDTLLNSKGQSVLVKLVEKKDEWVRVHNFEVDDQHTYFAGGLYVHNEEKGGGESRGDFKDIAIYKTVTTGSDGKADVSFKVPDNITSWRITTQAISKDWYAGKNIDFVPVGLPFFVETALNTTYLAGDSPTMRVRVFGTANIPDSIQYKIESGTLPFKAIDRNAGKVAEFNLGQLTPGKHKITISANGGGFKDSITRDVWVLNSYFTKNSSQYYDLSSSLDNVQGNTKGFTELLFTSQERGKLYSPLISYLWRGGIRIDQIGSRYMADVLLNKFFEEDREFNSIELRQYQTQSGGIALLPYSSDDLALSAQFADLIKGENVDISREGLKDYFYQSLNDRKADLSRVVQALYGLAALDEPVLVTLQNIKKDKSLTLIDKAYISLALDTIGAKEEARTYYRENFKPKLVNKKPYSYIDELKSKDDNIVITALLANLAGSLREPEADGLATYARENPPKETLVNFPLLGYIKKSLPQLKGGDVSFTYKTNQKNETKTLKKNEVFKLELNADELKTLRFENINGSIGLVSFFNREASPDEITKDDSLGITRKYYVNGRLTNEFNDGDLVKIELASSFGGRALPGLYQVTDYLPSGLRAVTRYNVTPIQTGQCISFASMVEDQKITFLDWNPKSTYCPSIFYYARVVTKGSYNAEPALIQSTKNLDSLNISAPAQINIK